jgi:hypothetical protein
MRQSVFHSSDRHARVARVMNVVTLLTVTAWSPLSAQQPERAQLGDAQFEVPAGWTSERRAGGLIFKPPAGGSVGDGSSVVAPIASPLTDFEVQFGQVVRTFQQRGRTERLGDIVRAKSPDGYNLLRRELLVRDTSGGTMYVFVTAADPNRKFQPLVFVANNAASYRRYGQQFDGMVNSAKFGASAPSATRGVSDLVITPPIPQPSVSVPAARVEYVDAKSRANGEANLHPAPPGTARLSGLFVTEDSRGAMGPGNSFYAAVSWRFYYFLPNGYAYLGAKEAGLESLVCDRPTVDKYGDPLCTTYSADDGQIRIGLRTPTRLIHKGDDLRIGDYNFAKVPRARELTLTGAYEYFAAGTAAAVSSTLTFSRDGRFEASNFTGIAVDNDATNSGVSGGSRVSVTGSSSGKAQGTYRINGYTLELHYSDGRTVRTFFAAVAGNDVVRIGSRTYIHH